MEKVQDRKFCILTVKPVDKSVSYVQSNPVEFTYLVPILLNFFAKGKADKSYIICLLK